MLTAKSRRKPPAAATMPDTGAAAASARALQLRLAKRAQRAREREAGLAHVQLTLPQALTLRLKVAQRLPDFERRLDLALQGWVVRVADYPALSQLVWNLNDEYLTVDDARSIYLRNWRHVDVGRLGDHERALIVRLTGDELIGG